MDTRNSTVKLLHTVNEIFSNTGYLKEKGKTYYNIPHYQRGYKWEPHNVEKLLDDVHNFEISDGKFYCLQNITITSRENYYNVIDGQQRLTTLIIILSILGEQRLVTQKVCFPENSIRKYTNQFLNSIVTNPEATFPNINWEEYSEKNPEFDLQDIGHIYNIFKAVEKWFHLKESLNPNVKSQFLTKLLDYVRIIVNEVSSETGEEKVFGNLNSKRIPLDGSDLIRAILITRVAREEGKKEKDIKNIVYVNERRVKLGWELDQINNWWGRNDVKGYFSKFFSIKSETIGGEKKLFDDEKYPINLLYLLYAESKGKPKLTLDLIEKNSSSAIALYKDILKLNNTLQDWYNDNHIYHYLGFLFNHKKKERSLPFNDIWKHWINSSTRNSFKNALKDKIKGFLFKNNETTNHKDLNINWYADREDELVMTLILMDIIHTTRNQYLKLPFNAFIKSANDIEHIFPQNPAPIKDKKAYIEFLNKNNTNGGKLFDLSGFDKKINDENFHRRLEEFIEIKTKEISINSIGNLVLLYNKLNKGISNSIYAVKRSRIIEFHNKGNYIQPHTFKIFVRDFNDKDASNRDHEYWTEEDIQRNSEYIKNQIDSFFKTLH